jgi:hypothetical protein
VTDTVFFGMWHCVVLGPCRSVDLQTAALVGRALHASWGLVLPGGSDKCGRQALAGVAGRRPTEVAPPTLLSVLTLLCTVAHTCHGWRTGWQLVCSASRPVWANTFGTVHAHTEW